MFPTGTIMFLISGEKKDYFCVLHVTLKKMKKQRIGGNERSNIIKRVKMSLVHYLFSYVSMRALFWSICNFFLIF